MMLDTVNEIGNLYSSAIRQGLFAAVFLALILLSIPGSNAGVQATQPNDNIRVQVVGLHWDHTSVVHTRLEVTFRILAADGQPVMFLVPTGAINVACGSDELSKSSYTHLLPAIQDGSSRDWIVSIPSLDPRLASINLEFYIRSPKTTSQETGVLSSTSDIDNIRMPAGADIPEQMDRAFTSAFGTRVTLTALTLLPRDRSGRDYLTISLKLTNTVLPDDIVNASAQLTDPYGRILGTGAASTAECKTLPKQLIPCPLDSPILPAPGSLINFRLTIFEQSPKLIRQIKWTSISAYVPLANIPGVKSGFKSFKESSILINGTEFHFQHVSGPFAFNFDNLTWVRSNDPYQIWRVLDAGWEDSSDPALPPIGKVEVAYWHADGTPILPGEYGAYIDAPAPTKQPLEVTFQSYRRREVECSPENVVVPAVGHATYPKLSLRDPVKSEVQFISVTSVPRDKLFTEHNTSDAYGRRLLLLRFRAPVTNGTILDPSLLTVRDENDNIVHAFALPSQPQIAQPSKDVSPKPRSFSMLVALAAPNIRTMSFHLIVAEDVPSQSPIYVTIDRDGIMRQATRPRKQTGRVSLLNRNIGAYTYTRQAPVDRLLRAFQGGFHSARPN